MTQVGMLKSCLLTCKFCITGWMCRSSSSNHHQHLEPCLRSSSKPQQTHLPVPAADPVGMFLSVVGDEEAQGRTKTPLLPDTKSVPATNLNTGVAA